MPAMFPESQDTCEVNGIVNTIVLIEIQDHRTNVLEAIPNFMVLLNSFSNKNVVQTSTTNPTNERTSIAKKRKLMKVCVDRTRSALKENMEENMEEKKSCATY